MICRESYLFIRGRYFMDKNFLTGKLSEYVRIKDELVETEEISEKVSMLKIRDTLLLIGNIIKEDLDEEFYIGTINAGIANKNIAFIIIKKNINSNIKTAGIIVDFNTDFGLI